MEGFAAANQKRGAGISTLEALAWKTGIGDALVCPMIDARRGDIYGAIYRRTRTAGLSDTLIEQYAPVVLKPAQWVAVLPRESLTLCGDGAIRYRSLLDREQWAVR